MAYDKDTDVLKQYRVDKMKDMEILEERRLGQQRFRDFDLAAFAKKTFSMFGGRDENVTLICRHELAGVIIDRFGSDIMLIPVDGGHFKVIVPVAVSPQFFGWAAGVGDGMRISGPEPVKEQYAGDLRELLEAYGEDNALKKR